MNTQLKSNEQSQLVEVEGSIQNIQEKQYTHKEVLLRYLGNLQKVNGNTKINKFRKKRSFALIYDEQLLKLNRSDIKENMNYIAQESVVQKNQLTEQKWRSSRNLVDSQLENLEIMKENNIQYQPQVFPYQPMPNSITMSTKDKKTTLKIYQKIKYQHLFTQNDKNKNEQSPFKQMYLSTSNPRKCQTSLQTNYKEQQLKSISPLRILQTPISLSKSTNSLRYSKNRFIKSDYSNIKKNSNSAIKVAKKLTTSFQRIKAIQKESFLQIKQNPKGIKQIDLQKEYLSYDNSQIVNTDSIIESNYGSVADEFIANKSKIQLHELINEEDILNQLFAQISNNDEFSSYPVKQLSGYYQEDKKLQIQVQKFEQQLAITIALCQILYQGQKKCNFAINSKIKCLVQIGLQNYSFFIKFIYDILTVENKKVHKNWIQKFNKRQLNKKSFEKEQLQSVFKLNNQIMNSNIKELCRKGDQEDPVIICILNIIKEMPNMNLINIRNDIKQSIDKRNEIQNEQYNDNKRQNMINTQEVPFIAQFILKQSQIKQKSIMLKTIDLQQNIYDSSKKEDSKNIEHNEDEIIDDMDNDENRQIEDNGDLSPLISAPFLPQIQSGKIFTLVLDLDETLIHFQDEDNDEGFYMIRPGAMNFLKNMNEHFEIIIFTAALQSYADWVIDQIDVNRIIVHRLYRQHTTKTEGGYCVKDLTYIGRDLSTLLIVDNLEISFKYQPNNGILIKSWYDDLDDTCLITLTNILDRLLKLKPIDLRRAIATRSTQLKQIQ